MTRKLKTLGLVLTAVLAVGALSATAASAASFHSEVAHTIISGAQPENVNDVVSVNAGTITCNTATYSGTTASATAEALTVVPSYKGCTAFGFVNAVIDINGCAYSFTTQYWHIQCPSGQYITTTAFNCHVKIGSQTLLGVSYTNSGAGATRDLHMHINASGITYTQESKSFPGCTSGTFSNGSFKWSATVTGADTVGNHVGIWVT